jgi:hypothetical protein
MVHVFSAHASPDSEHHSPLPECTLLGEGVQDALLADFPAEDRPKMRLILNHFANKTVQTFSPGRASVVAWLEATPSLVKDHRFVLNGLLAVGSLHLSKLTNIASERDDYQDIAATQMNAGMAQYRKEVQNVTTSNAEALFAYSTAITTFVLGTADTECRNALDSLNKIRISDKQHDEATEILVRATCRTFRAIRGVLVILVPSYYHIRSGKFEPVVERDWWPPPIPVTSEELEHDKKLRNLEKMWSQPGKTYEYCFDSLRHALKNLRETSALVSRLATCTFPGDTTDEETFDWTAIMGWPTGLPLEFLSLLEQRRMEAWVIMAHYALLPAKVKINPWLDGFATNIIRTSALVIGKENWHWISWPATALGIELKTLPSINTVV